MTRQKEPYYKTLIAEARELRRTQYEYLSSLSLEALNTATSESLCRLSSTRPTDSQSVIKIASLVYTLIKLRKDHFPSLIKFLNSLRCDKDEQTGIFLSFVYSKLLKHVQRGYMQERLDECLVRLRHSMHCLLAAYFLYFLTKFSRNSILLCISKFSLAITKAVLHSRSDVRIVRSDTLSFSFRFCKGTKSQTASIRYLRSIGSSRTSGASSSSNSTGPC